MNNTSKIEVILANKAKKQEKQLKDFLEDFLSKPQKISINSYTEKYKPMDKSIFNNKKHDISPMDIEQRSKFANKLIACLQEDVKKGKRTFDVDVITDKENKNKKQLAVKSEFDVDFPRPVMINESLGKVLQRQPEIEKHAKRYFNQMKKLKKECKKNNNDFNKYIHLAKQEKDLDESSLERKALIKKLMSENSK